MTDIDLISRLQKEMQAAMKAGQKDRVSTLRMLLSEAKNADIQKPPSTPGTMVEAHAKRLRKAREEYERLGKTEEVAKLSAEIAVSEEFLPKQASADEAARLVETFLAQYPELKAADTGRAMGMFMKEHGGAGVEPGTASALIRQRLQAR